MAVAKRIFLFLAINVIVVVTLSLVLNILHVQPFLKSYGLDMRSLLIFCLIWGMGGALISLALSRQMAKWMMGVRVIDPNTREAVPSQLLATVSRLARDAHLPDMPEVGIFESPEPNAFATGPTKKRSLVAVSTGLLNRMSQKELEGVLAHGDQPYLQWRYGDDDPRSRDRQRVRHVLGARARLCFLRAGKKPRIVLFRIVFVLHAICVFL